MNYYFIGIKGSGMASLATIMHDLHHEVSGSDIEKFIFTQQPLEARGIQIYSFNQENIKPGMSVIIGNAFSEEHEEVVAARKLQKEGLVQAYRYHEFLGELMKSYISISVAGTHGKTTTTGLLAHVMDHVSPTGYLIGDGNGVMKDDGQYFVVESCEYKRHFLAYQPDYAIITNIELDHVDYYRDMEDYLDAFQTFANQVKKGIVLFGDDPYLAQMQVTSNHLYYGLNANNDVRAINVEEDENGIRFDIMYHNEFFGHFDLPFVGKPLLWNSIGVIAVGILSGLTAEQLQTGLVTFPGVKRRFTTEVNGENIYIDDYAHHPTAVKYMIEAAKTKYPNKKVIAIFKPDRFSRIEAFLDRFGEELNQADEAYICDFPENAQREEGVVVTIDDLKNKLTKGTLISEDEAGAKFLASRGPAVYLFMSSKDIYKLKNIVKSFQ